MSLRILIVDDDHLSRDALSELLSDEGYHIDSCVEGSHALALLQQATYDVLLTDLIMPGMNGLELIHAARKLHGSLKCILLSGHAPRAEAAAFVTWQGKPVDIDALLLKIKQ